MKTFLLSGVNFCKIIIKKLRSILGLDRYANISYCSLSLNVFFFSVDLDFVSYFPYNLGSHPKTIVSATLTCLNRLNE